jgi:hypothetical protein
LVHAQEGIIPKEAIMTLRFFIICYRKIDTLKRIDIVWIGGDERPGEQILHAIVTGGKPFCERVS